MSRKGSEKNDVLADHNIVVNPIMANARSKGDGGMVGVNQQALHANDPSSTTFRVLSTLSDTFIRYESSSLSSAGFIESATVMVR